MIKGLSCSVYSKPLVMLMLAVSFILYAYFPQPDLFPFVSSIENPILNTGVESFTVQVPPLSLNHDNNTSTLIEEIVIPPKCSSFRLNSHFYFADPYSNGIDRTSFQQPIGSKVIYCFLPSYEQVIKKISFLNSNRELSLNGNDRISYLLSFNLSSPSLSLLKRQYTPQKRLNNTASLHNFDCVTYLDLQKYEEKKTTAKYYPLREFCSQLIPKPSFTLSDLNVVKVNPRALDYTLQNSNPSFDITQHFLQFATKKQLYPPKSTLNIPSFYFFNKSTYATTESNLILQFEPNKISFIYTKDSPVISMRLSVDNLLAHRPISFQLTFINSALSVMDFVSQEKPFLSYPVLNTNYFYSVLFTGKRLLPFTASTQYNELLNIKFKDEHFPLLTDMERQNSSASPSTEAACFELRKHDVVLDIPIVQSSDRVFSFSTSSFNMPFYIVSIDSPKYLFQPYFSLFAYTLSYKNLLKVVSQASFPVMPSYLPSLQQHQISLDQRFPHLSLAHVSISQPVHFAFDLEISQRLNTAEIQVLNEESSINLSHSLDAFLLPKFAEKVLITKFDYQNHKSTLNLLQPSPQRNEATFARLFSKILDLGKYSIAVPDILESPVIPGFTIALSPPLLKEQLFNHTREKTIPLQMELTAISPVRRKKVLPINQQSLLKKASEEITTPNIIAELMLRNPQFPNTKALISKHPFPEAELLLKNPQSSIFAHVFSKIPDLEKYSIAVLDKLESPVIPEFAIAMSLPLLQEQLFNHTKEKTIPLQMELTAISPVRRKKTLPISQQCLLKKTSEEITVPNIIAELMLRNPQFPNTKALIRKHSIPEAELLLRNPQSSITNILTTKTCTAETAAIPEIVSNHFLQPALTMIHSKAKEILEDYEQENKASPNTFALTIPELESSLSRENIRFLNQSSRFTHSFLTEVPPPSYLETVTYNNEFESEIYYSPREEGKGYSFAIKLKPNSKIKVGSSYQNYLFIIDGSSSIKKHRFSIFKEGVSHALSYLKEGDTFNILVADAELIPFNKSSVSWNKSNISKAKNFLHSREYRGFFINYNAFDLLADAANFLSPEKENIIVLITDGYSFETLKHHKEGFIGLAEASKGRFSVFTATASNKNNLAMLDLLSTFNHGELMYSNTNAAFPRQLAKFVKHLEQAIAKDIHVHVTSHIQETGIEFYPNQEVLPALYIDHPYTIYGSIDKLKDFDIILQGRSGDKWINIKQHISFKHAEPAPYSIKRGFALQQAYVCYDTYLKNDDPFFLNEAERILSPMTIPTATR